ncbi:hypothetical protein LJR231_001591 [Phyllobacterium sp. LjRoot231]|uniref:hypothetical protein n=1 Tax=Phyllobacterium sp. LjRoot231 TaxID=3342289 RepID=UPI003ECF32E1
MALSEKQMEHPKYWEFELTARRGLRKILSDNGLTEENIKDHHETQAGRLVDDMVAFLLRVSK